MKGLNDWKKQFRQILIEQKTHRPSRCRNRQRPSFALSGVAEASQDVFMGGLRKTGKDHCFRHARREIVEDVADRDPGAAHTGFAETDAWVDANVGVERYGSMIIPLAMQFSGLMDKIGVVIGSYIHGSLG